MTLDILFNNDYKEIFHNSTRSMVIYKNDKNIILRSYNSIVAKIENNKLILGPAWNYSVTTAKHLNNFLNKFLPGQWSTPIIKKAIKKENNTINGIDVLFA